MTGSRPNASAVPSMNTGMNAKTPELGPPTTIASSDSPLSRQQRKAPRAEDEQRQRSENATSQRSDHSTVV